MHPDEICFLAGLLWIPFFFLFLRRVLFDPKWRVLFFSMAIVLAIGALSQLKNTTPGKPNFYLFLLCPLYGFSLLQLMLYFFRYNFNRDPEMAKRRIWSTEDDGLGWDRIFNLVFLILSISAPILLLGYFYP